MDDVLDWDVFIVDINIHFKRNIYNYKDFN